MRSAVSASPVSSALTTPRRSTITRVETPVPPRRRNTQDDRARARRELDQVVNRGLRPDIDALGWLIENQDDRFRAEKPTQDNLLLIPTRELEDRPLFVPGTTSNFSIHTCDSCRSRRRTSRPRTVTEFM